MRDDAALVSSFTALRYRDLCRASMVSEAAKRAAIALVLNRSGTMLEKFGVRVFQRFDYGGSAESTEAT